MSLEVDVRKATADSLKYYFYEAKREQLGGRSYRPHPRMAKPEFWLVAADNCIEIGADPYSFVRASFLYNQVPGGPFPNMMATKAAVRHYEDYQKLHGIEGQSKQDVFENEIRQILLSTQVKAFQQQVFPNVRDFFLDDSVTPLDSVPAFVRVVLMPDEAVFRKYGLIAYQQLVSNPKLMDVLRALKMDLTFMEKVKQQQFSTKAGGS